MPARLEATIILINGVDQDGDSFAEVFPYTDRGRTRARSYWDDKTQVSYEPVSVNRVELYSDDTQVYTEIVL